MRLIDADALKDDAKMGHDCNTCQSDWKKCQYEKAYPKMDVCAWIDDTPTVDAVPVVRCNDCKYWGKDKEARFDDVESIEKKWRFCDVIKHVTPEDWFCRSGDKKEARNEGKMGTDSV